MFNIFKKKEVGYQNINVQEFDRLRNIDNHVILDVRSPQELAEGSIPNHMMINMFEPDFQSRISNLDRDKTYLVYCRSGGRSGQACGMMVDMGFENVYNLSGGITAWNSQLV